ncbi:hypothetical protein ALMP_67830 [Streptomyces sp. A012304]|nr:hypothetical protein ALMP_67830 [Streptomyces sp. A012304]
MPVTACFCRRLRTSGCHRRRTASLRYVWGAGRVGIIETAAQGGPVWHVEKDSGWQQAL